MRGEQSAQRYLLPWYQGGMEGIVHPRRYLGGMVGIVHPGV